MTFGEIPKLGALWYVDISAFRSINPKFGYLTGNKVLHALADGIKEYLCGDLPITRLGGDRFVFVSAGFDFEGASERVHSVGDVAILVEISDGIIKPVDKIAHVR